MSKQTSYSVFRNHLYKFSKSIKCPMCEETMLSKFFEKHCKSNHGLNPSTLCVFCRNVTWPVGEKMKNTDHMHKCHKKFTVLYRDVINFSEPTFPKPAPPETICPCASFRSEDLCRRTKQIPEWSENDKLNGGVHLMYEPMFTLNDDDWCRLPKYEELLDEATRDEKLLALLNPLQFHSWSGLDEAVKWIHRYIYYGKRFGWYHVCVRAGCMKSFVESLRGLEMVELPYGCVCKGRGSSKMFSEEALKLTWQHHRHAILVVKDKLKFKQCLEKHIRYDTGKVPQNGKKYYCTEIKNVGHLISTITYVSRPFTECKCDEIESKYWSNDILTETEKINDSSFNDVHYYIFKPVIHHANLWMLLVVPGGELDASCRFRVSPRSVHNMKSKFKCNNKWYVSACEEIGIRNCVVLFNPLDMCIGDIIEPDNLMSYVKNTQSDERWFVYWFEGKLLKVTKIDQEQKQLNDFQNYYFTNKINTLLNGRDNFFYLPRAGQRTANDLSKLEADLKAKHDEENTQMLKDFEQRLREMPENIENLKAKHNEQNTQMRKDFEQRLREMTENNEKLKTEKNELEQNLKLHIAFINNFDEIRKELINTKNNLKCTKQILTSTKKDLKCTKKEMKDRSKEFKMKEQTLKQELKYYQNKRTLHSNEEYDKIKRQKIN